MKKNSNFISKVYAKPLLYGLALFFAITAPMETSHATTISSDVKSSSDIALVQKEPKQKKQESQLRQLANSIIKTEFAEEKSKDWEAYISEVIYVAKFKHLDSAKISYKLANLYHAGPSLSPEIPSHLKWFKHIHQPAPKSRGKGQFFQWSQNFLMRQADFLATLAVLNDLNLNYNIFNLRTQCEIGKFERQVVFVASDGTLISLASDYIHRPSIREPQEYLENPSFSELRLLLRDFFNRVADPNATRKNYECRDTGIQIGEIWETAKKVFIGMIIFGTIFAIIGGIINLIKNKRFSNLKKKQRKYKELKKGLEAVVTYLDKITKHEDSAYRNCEYTVYTALEDAKSFLKEYVDKKSKIKRLDYKKLKSDFKPHLSFSLHYEDFENQFLLLFRFIRETAKLIGKESEPLEETERNTYKKMADNLYQIRTRIYKKLRDVDAEIAVEERKREMLRLAEEEEEQERLDREQKKEIEYDMDRDKQISIGMNAKVLESKAGSFYR